MKKSTKKLFAIVWSIVALEPLLIIPSAIYATITLNITLLLFVAILQFGMTVAVGKVCKKINLMQGANQ